MAPSCRRPRSPSCVRRSKDMARPAVARDLLPSPADDCRRSAPPAPAAPARRSRAAYPCVMSKHDLDASRTARAVARRNRGRPWRGCRLGDDRWHESWHRRDRSARLEGAAPHHQHGSGNVMALCRRSDETRTRHALQHDPSLLILGPTTTTSHLHDLEPVQRPERMTVHTRCSQHSRSRTARRPSPDAHRLSSVGAKHRTFAHAGSDPYAISKRSRKMHE